MIDYVVKTVAVRFAGVWETHAGRELGSTRREYMRNLYLGDAGKMEGIVGLTGDLPMMLEEGASPFDMKCIVNAKTNIYTSKGYKMIKDLKVGDLVLTHKGKFKKISKLWKEKNTDKYIYKIKVNTRGGNGRNNKALMVTGNHPFLTDKGWKRADKLNQEKDKIITSANKCINCGELVPSHDVDYDNIICSNFCKGKYSINKGILGDWLKKNAKNNSKWGFGSWDEELKNKAHKKSLKSFSFKRPTYPENKLWEYIKDIPNIKRQYMFERNVKTPIRGINKKFYFDFAIPEHKICIEVNGERFHTKEQDEERRKIVEYYGWTYLSFWSKEIYSNTVGCANEIKRLLNNHNDNYYFVKTNFKIEKINFDKLSKHCTTYNNKYNITVEDDSSYVANGIVTHNSGFANSDKAKTPKDGKGWYLTIPMRIATPEALGESEVFSGIMPTEVHNIAKSKEVDENTGKSDPVKPNELPSKFKPQKKEVYIPKSDTYRQYQHKTSIYAGIRKETDKENNQNRYVNFRRVSDKSDAASWQHPGFEPYKIMEKAWADFSGDIDQIIDDQTDEILSQMGFK